MKILKSLREKKKITQEQLANELGVDRSTVAKWETTELFPRAETMLKISRLLECNIEVLFLSEE